MKLVQKTLLQCFLQPSFIFFEVKRQPVQPTEALEDTGRSIGCWQKASLAASNNGNLPSRP